MQDEVRNASALVANFQNSENKRTQKFYSQLCSFSLYKYIFNTLSTVGHLDRSATLSVGIFFPWNKIAPAPSIPAFCIEMRESFSFAVYNKRRIYNVQFLQSPKHKNLWNVQRIPLATLNITNPFLYSLCEILYIIL